MNQVSDSSLPPFVDVCQSIGVSVEPRTEVRIEGKIYRNVLVLTYKDFFRSFVLLRSFENIKTIEGVELDWIWIDEIQDVSDDSFKVATSRLRGNRIKDNDVPSRLLACTGLITPHYFDHFTSKQKSFFDCMFVSSSRENEKNLPPDYVDMLLQLYTKEEVEMFVEGRPVFKPKALRKVFDFDYNRDVLSEPWYPLDLNNVIVSVDFNNSPLCASVYAQKPFESIWICFDEIELWGATVYDLIEVIRSKEYGGILIGDASGNKKNTISDYCEYDILEQHLSDRFQIVRGLSASVVKGFRSFFNPPVRDTVRDANFLLEKELVKFNPSKLESGGVPASVASCLWDYSTNVIDKRSDRSNDPRAARTHFADTFRYFAYFLRRYIISSSENFRFYEEVNKYGGTRERLSFV